MYSHALILRLFLSNSFFSVHAALQYLRLYADNIGITHYLTSRLRELPTPELWDVWGFICHLLVTRPSKSVALECFVVERAEQSTHIYRHAHFLVHASLGKRPRSHTPRHAVIRRVPACPAQVPSDHFWRHRSPRSSAVFVASDALSIAFSKEKGQSAF
ncbi:hypothetical protein JB92DRAFT_2992497 [Gautieria morchelliformis]|nr:hypothetical protein JB92DRAFT_2992497 [Gautieria morchelliformis]